MPTILSKLEESIHRKGLNWKVGTHPLSQLPLAEQRKRLLPGAPAAEIAALNKFYFVPTKIPRTFDWRSVDGRSYVTPPKDQGGNPVCIAYAVTGAVESSFLMTLDPFLTNMGGFNSIIDLSEHALYALNTKYPSVREFLMGIGMLPDAFYKEGAAAPSAGWQLETVRVGECQHYQGLTMDEVKALIVFGGPFVAGLNVPDDFFAYGGGIYASTSSNIAGFHLVLVIGYDDTQKCFICKNSWGQGWGESGYFRIAYSEFQGGHTGFGTLIDTYAGVRMTNPVRTPLALKTLNGNYLTMVNGGGLGGPNSGPGAVALHTDATRVGPWEVFQLEWIDADHFAIKTINGNYLTAVNGGGVGGPNSASCPVHTDATASGSWERLYLSYNHKTGQATIQTADGHYLTAVNGGGGGGPNTTPVHSDAIAIGPWEKFTLEVAAS
jgi:hypothetical protein